MNSQVLLKKPIGIMRHYRLNRRKIRYTLRTTKMIRTRGAKEDPTGGDKYLISEQLTTAHIETLSDNSCLDAVTRNNSTALEEVKHLMIQFSLRGIQIL